jgi:tRNA A-37 threonylcarbamoyl transferase component Bud32
MIESFGTPDGRIVMISEEMVDTFLLLEMLERGHCHASAQDFGGVQAYVKASALTGSSARRHALRRAFLRVHPPRLREYQNLTWLRARLFQTPRPMAAGVSWRAGLPRHQVLVTEWLPEHPTLDVFWASADDEQRSNVLDELAREVARMHALRFLHSDLFARNLLVGPDTGQRRVVFLDAWAGGPDPSLRGSAYDLACLFLDGPWLEDGWRQRFFDAYVAGRAAQERPVDRASLLRKVEAYRTRLRNRLVREPKRLHGAELPRASLNDRP